MNYPKFQVQSWCFSALFMILGRKETEYSIIRFDKAIISIFPIVLILLMNKK
jgi:hypothetical protein